MYFCMEGEVLYLYKYTVICLHDAPELQITQYHTDENETCYVHALAGVFQIWKHWLKTCHGCTILFQPVIICTVLVCYCSRMWLSSVFLLYALLGCRIVQILLGVRTCCVISSPFKTVINMTVQKWGTERTLHTQHRGGCAARLSCCLLQEIVKLYSLCLCLPVPFYCCAQTEMYWHVDRMCQLRVVSNICCPKPTRLSNDVGFTWTWVSFVRICHHSRYMCVGCCRSSVGFMQSPSIHSKWGYCVFCYTHA
jgi:hypothetical protein